MDNMDNKEKVLIEIYADGVYFPKPRLGGIASLILFPDGTTMNLSRGYENTDTLRMKITSVISSLDGAAQLIEKKIIKPGTYINLLTDSESVVNCITRGWLRAWQSNGWFLTTTGKPVKNAVLLEELSSFIHRIEKSGVKLDFTCIAGIGTPIFFNPCVLDAEKTLYYYKGCNKLAVEAFRRLEKSLLKS